MRRLSILLLFALSANSFCFGQDAKPPAGKQAYLIFKELPILGEQSTLAARVALAANKQGAYWKVHEVLVNMSVPVTPELINQIASRFSLNVEKLKQDVI